MGSTSRLVTRVLATAALVVFLAGGGYAISSALGDDDVATATRGDTQKSTNPTPKPPRPPVVRLRLTVAGTLDPEGDERENDPAAPLAVDGSATTGWKTESYQSFFKKGVGLVLDAGATRRLVTLDVSSATPGVVAEIRAGTKRTGPFRRIATGRPLAAATRFGLGGKRGRYVVVWITAIPGGGAAEIDEVTLRARKR